jgi:hypothetical protein
MHFFLHLNLFAENWVHDIIIILLVLPSMLENYMLEFEIVELIV